MKTAIETLDMETMTEHRRQQAERADSRRAKLDIDAAEFEGVLLSIPRLCRGLQEVAYSYNLDGVLMGYANQTQHNTTHENALDFVEAYYELTAGAIALIEAATNIVSIGLANGDIAIESFGGSHE